MAPAVETSWRHPFEAWRATRHGGPRHVLFDEVANPGEEVVVRARFTYGSVLKDLEDEAVSLWVRLSDPCGGWKAVAYGRTDRRGWATFAIAPEDLAGTGHYELQAVVGGDRSRARGSLAVVPSGQKTAVFDIDGTLTEGDGEIVEELLLGREPEMFAAADEVVRRYSASGYLVVYMTGRPETLKRRSQAWLDRHAFPAGVLRTAQGLDEALPTPDGVGRTKREYLLRLRAEAAVDLRFAYGNAFTDVCAYAEAGIDPRATFIIGPHAGRACRAGFAATNPVRGDYRDHVSRLDPP